MEIQVNGPLTHQPEFQWAINLGGGGGGGSALQWGPGPVPWWGVLKGKAV